MRTLEQILNSFIESHNNKEIPNYVDLRDLEILVNLEKKHPVLTRAV
tara:strand:- start:3093 stop:3233 length:141 start_codon:yes stop_codon:yes gene_type:complete